MTKNADAKSVIRALMRSESISYTAAARRLAAAAPAAVFATFYFDQKAGVDAPGTLRLDVTDQLRHLDRDAVGDLRAAGWAYKAEKVYDVGPAYPDFLGAVACTNPGGAAERAAQWAQARGESWHSDFWLDEDSHNREGRLVLADSGTTWPYRVTFVAVEVEAWLSAHWLPPRRAQSPRPAVSNPWGSSQLGW